MIFLFAALFAGLSSQDEFKKTGKKIIIVAISKDDKTFHIHKNIIIDETTTVNNYLEKIKNSIQSFYESGYPITTFNLLQVKLWEYNPQATIKGKKASNTVHQFRRSFHTSSLINLNKSLNLIKPLKIPKNINKTLIATIDLETIELNNNQIPISISFSYILNEELITIFELIDYDLLLNNPDQAVKLLWLTFMNKINDLNLHKCIIFSHNLGSFDGYFIFKGLLGLPGVNIDKVNSIIDDLQRFISIDIAWKESKFIFKDSIRIFPISLQQLCNTFEVEGKLFPYNPEFNKISLFKNPALLNQFIEYSKQDSISLLKALTDLLDFNPNAKVYIHNFSNFDYMFIIKVLFENFKVKPFFRNNKVINLVYQFKDNDKSKIYLFDSYLILPSSLRTLASKYKINDQKGYFPYTFVNESTLDYIGITPDIRLFNGISNEEYEGIISYTWNLRNELIRYLELDLKSLYQIISRFSQDIFNIEKIDITKLPTISSIAFKIFRTNYLGDSKLPIIKGNAHKEMRNAFYGGVVEVFKNEGRNLKLYDITSLYPFAMLNDMPTGDSLFSTDPNINNYFGIVFVEVDTTGLDPKYLDYPLLPHRIDGRMYNPLGVWTGWYFSEEIKLAISKGYSVKVIGGYKFDKTSNIFNSFINKFFNIKAGSSQIKMDRTTAKMILNSLFGRLGMKPNQDIIEIVDSSKALDILSKFNVKEQYQITDNLEFLRYDNTPITGFLELYGKDEYLNFMLDCDSKNISVNQSLPSAIAITAYARMYMFNIIYRLIDLGIEIYYMDTDSIVVNGVLPKDLIGDDLGLFKLEHEIKHGYFISPKLYALETKDGKLIVKAKGSGRKLEFTQFESLINNQPKSPLEQFWDKLKNRNNKEDITIQPLKIAIDKLFSDDEPDLIGGELLPEARQVIAEALEQPDIKPVTPETPVNSDSPPSSLDRLFTDPSKTVETKPEVPAGFGSLFDQINAKRKDFDSNS